MTQEDAVAAIGRALAERRLADALDGIRALPVAIRGEFAVKAQEADLLGRLGRIEEELVLLRELHAEHPDNASLLVSIGYALKSLGRIDDAVAIAREAIALGPTYGRPWWLLSDIKRYRFSDDDRAAMEATLAVAAGDADRVALHFALASAYDREGQAEEAFRHYAAGNAMRLAAIDPRALTIAPKVDRAIASLADPITARGFDSDAPIFVVGAPRSGTSLIEQILASHPDVEGVGELPVLPQLVREVATDAAMLGSDAFRTIAAMDADQLRALGEAYCDRARPFRTSDRPRFVDKQPANWSHVPIIRRILPNAVIVDARRHPMAVGWSNFQQNYSEGMAFAFGLREMGDYLREYLRLMEAMDAADPGAVHHVVNERLVADPEGGIRALLDHCGLPFDPACLDFHRTDRGVRTPSADQVRRPLNADRTEAWMAYRPWLPPLEDALGDALDRWDKVD